MASKVIGTKSFRISESLTIECEMKRTRSGTRENAVVYENGYEIGAGTDFWINRPWYPFTYANAIYAALKTSKRFTPEQVKTIMDALRAEDLERVTGMFRSIAAVAMIGEVLTEDTKEQNDWKLRMLKAGLPGIDVPEDWDSLSEDEKKKRLDKVTSIMG